MTNKDKIKEEIERIRVKEDNSITPDQSKHYTHYHVGRRELCDTLLQFIDSLPEEPKKQPKFKVGDTIKGPCNNIFQVKEVLDKQYVLHSENGDELNSIEIVDKYSCLEEPASGDLENIIDIIMDKKIMYASREEGIESFAKTYSFNIESILFNQLTLEQQKLWRKEIENAAINGGEMGLELANDKRYDKELSEDLEEAANFYANTHIEWFDSEGNPCVMPAFKAGAQWQKQRMMEDAVETTIVNDWQYGKDPDHAIIPAIHQRIKGFNVGDKVKLIIVKEE